MRPSLAALAATCALATACALDFDQFRTPSRPDAVVALDVSTDLGVADVIDASVDRAPVDVPRVDVAIDRVTCTPGRSDTGSFRFAHMAADLGAVNLCMRRRTGTEAFQPVSASSWPAGGIGYGQVSTATPFNAVITRTNDPWEFAVVSVGTPCSQAAGGALTLRSAQLDPGVMRLFVLTTERSPDGGVVGVLNVLSDESCTDCQSRQVDVRAVHAVSASASQRLSFSLDPVIDPRLLGTDLASMRVFAASVGYGSASDYACNALWGAFTVPAFAVIQVQLSALTAAGTVIARSDSTRLKSSLLSQTRVVTVFLEGSGSGPQSFVLCYDGLGTAGLANCDRITARPVIADAGADATVDASWHDATLDVTSADAASDIAPLDAAADDVFPDAAADDDLADDTSDADDASDASVASDVDDASDGV